jgi:hypothetical protein
MAFPTLAETITVKGQYLDPSGEPARGYILVTLDQSLADKDTNTIYTRKPLRYDLDGNGEVEFDIVKTGATDADPVALTRNVAVTITENFDGVKKYTWKTVFDTSANDETDIFQLADAAEVTQRPLNQYVLLGTYAADLNAKASTTYVNATFAPKASPTFTGTVSGVTKTHVGLGNVDNESKATMFTNPVFTGSFRRGVQTRTSTATLTVSDVPFQICTSGTFTLNLPATTLAGLEFIIKNNGAGTISTNSIVLNGAAAAVQTVAAGAVLRVVSSGTSGSWYSV